LGDNRGEDDLKRLATAGLLMILACSLGLGAGCSKQQQEAPPAETAPPPAQMESTTPPAGTTATAAYVCPMHPAVTSDAPGKCSECGMDLVAAGGTGTGAAPDTSHAGHGH
jgi:hypothetical protein